MSLHVSKKLSRYRALWQSPCTERPMKELHTLWWWRRQYEIRPSTVPYKYSLKACACCIFGLLSVRLQCYLLPRLSTVYLLGYSFPPLRGEMHFQQTANYRGASDGTKNMSFRDWPAEATTVQPLRSLCALYDRSHLST